MSQVQEKFVLDLKMLHSLRNKQNFCIIHCETHCRRQFARKHASKLESVAIFDSKPVKFLEANNTMLSLEDIPRQKINKLRQEDIFGIGAMAA